MRLVDVDTLITEYDRVHVGEPGGARKLMVKAPTVDAIPIEWIESQVDKGKWAELVQRWAEREGHEID